MRRGLGLFPLVALAVPIVLSVLASVAFVPPWLRILTAPWFGAVGRIDLLAVAPICLLASVVLARGLDADGRFDADGEAHVPRRPRAIALLVGVACLLGATAVPVVAGHREDLAATLAGAGDTPAMAKSLSRILDEGETVLNFEGDGSANLFAAGRVPVLAAYAEPSADSALGRDYVIARNGLMSIADPAVAGALARLRVAYVAIGTTSMYWGSPYVEPVGYDVGALIRQPGLQVAMAGSDLVVLRYQPRTPQ